MQKRSLDGWRGTAIVAVAGLVAVSALLGAALWFTRNDGGLDPAVFAEPGGRPLPGTLICDVPDGASPAPVTGPSRAVALTALRDGEVIASDDEGGLWRGNPATGALARWADQPEIGPVQAIARDPLGRMVFVAGPGGVAALDLGSAGVVSLQPLPPDTAGDVASLAATTRRTYVLTTGAVLLESRWAYEELGTAAPMPTRAPLRPATAVLAAPDGEALLLATDGPLVRLGTDSGRPQDVPVGDAVQATSISQGADGLVYLVDGDGMRVLDLNERWVTGRLSAAAPGWTTPAAEVAAVPDGLLAADAAGALSFWPLPECNREELTRLDLTPSG